MTHNTRQTTQGAWMKDPLGTMGTETIFVMKSYYLNNVVEEFENMDKFKKGTTRKTYSLPYQYDGTGAVVSLMSRNARSRENGEFDKILPRLLAKAANVVNLAKLAIQWRKWQI